MNFIRTEIDGVVIIEPRRYGDERGYFCETFKREEFEREIGKVDFIQDNESLSRRGVVRGLHFQRGASSQAKLVRVSQGEVVDVVVDLRGGSPTFGRHLAVTLSAVAGRQMFVPRGFAHGFAVISDVAQFQYKVDNVYDPASEVTLAFDDPALGIKWPLNRDEMILSPKDLCGLSLADVEPF